MVTETEVTEGTITEGTEETELCTGGAEKRVYKGTPLDASYRIDLIVEELVVVELKSVSALLSVHQAQVLTYLKIAECPAGLLINFNVPRLMDGVKRLINPRAPLKRDEP